MNALTLKRIVICALIAALAGCGPRPGITGMAPRPEGANVERVFVATMRSRDQTGAMFGQKRSKVMQYGSLEVSIPPLHQAGQIESVRGKEPDPSREFASVGYDVAANFNEFSNDLKRYPGGNGAVLVFVHGYNNTLEEAAFRLAQIQSDFKLKDPGVLFAWPSAGDPRGYVYDRDSVLFARDDLENLIRDLRRKGHRRIFLLAHSMGSYLAMEALRQIAIKGDRQVFDSLEAVALMSPDIDPDVFRRMAEEIGELPQPFVILTSKEDKILGLSGLLTGRKPRLGRIENAEEVAGLGVTVVDFSALTTGNRGGHMVPVSSPIAIQLLRGMEAQIGRGSGRFHDYVLLGRDGASLPVGARIVH